MTVEPPERDAEMRRRAAWLLGMLAVVAALFVTLMVTFLGNSGNDSDRDDQAGPTDLPTQGTTTSPGTPSSTRPSSRGPASPTGTSTTGSPTGAGSGSGVPTDGPTTCPRLEPCAFDSDIGGAVKAINTLRTTNGKPAVPGRVTAAAKRCALSKGDDCVAGYAYTFLYPLDGPAAVQKLVQLGDLLGSMRSVEVGWALDPQIKQYGLAIIRHD
ncbi:hypothetical protein [Jatrophihabitans fulvus]